MNKNLILKHPWNYSAKEIEEIMFIPLRFHVGEINSGKVKQLVEGQIVKVILASNSPFLPAELIIKLADDTEVQYCVLELKGVSHI